MKLNKDGTISKVAIRKLMQAENDAYYEKVMPPNGSFNLPNLGEQPKDSPQAEFLKGIEATYAQCLDIVRKKNADYAVSSDPFLNFRNASVVGVSPERAILVRVMDKISRISNLIDKDADVKDETIEDTIHDAINYLAILKEKLCSTQKESKN